MSEHAAQSDHPPTFDKDAAAAAAARSGGPGRWLPRVRIASLAIIVLSLVVLMRLLPLNRLVSALASKIQSWGAYGPLVFGLAYVAAAVLFVPGSALTLAAGAIFGLWKGTLIVSIASTTAAGLAFLIGRYVAREQVRRWAANNRRFAMIDQAIGRGGWKIVALLRLSPAVPFSIGNYLFGLTPIRFGPYVLASWVAMLPGTFLYVYLGYAGRAGLSATAGGGAAGRSPMQWALLVVGLIATVVVTVYVTRLARRAVTEQTKEAGGPAPETNGEQHQAHAPRRRPARPIATVVLATVAILLATLTGFACTHRSLVASLFGPPAVKMKETYAQKTGGPTFDHSAFSALLAKHVNDAGFVDYKGFAADAAQLDAYLAAIAKAPFDQMGREERLALLINAYNASTLRLILDHYPLKSIRDIPASKRWDDQRWNVGGHVLSLNQIEHEQIRPNFKEPRVHFALVCAAVGCPPLRNEAYTGQRIEEQLDAQAKYVHAHDRWFSYEPDKQAVHLTSLYNWYSGDFEQAAGSAEAFAARYAPELKAALDGGKKPRIEWLDYDWSLNDKSNQR